MIINNKINYQKILNYIYFLTLLISVILLLMASSFLYKNFYQAIESSKKILSLKGTVASVIVDVNLFNKLIEENKKNSSRNEIINFNNPF
ncbi:hypothetical protein CO115_01200 [Candidatus Falkowbacteria bacterium CG_4_9_14_3_um_filter_36_9]|uniref:Uncharacterized protein n=2 Tax=Candidatus Falkowiibacteriota TaxID=1752728 RepID=A0A1J4T832_9BACT|nr:MAG: hypothetical protein AUJ27_03065 [Candidatus Falkowbacteria bacterium CG1_02_37_44]PIV50238.1 MAG: hypothetical protein COS18_05535 [Candidatus Falkowbacteria bacterium CG02_land_8_20_14_3_00_36_14]PIX11805.1 MAG: hypothetical protein COZ73_01780 [Candidatus Falkowbacteria bacterium CG_4_8_14_3_um_filter_36_11]PJA10930.1 MAG: hypothetical protein COX67_02435 [Candidatus Falkowbacteria bacterium CG_4_10_14_0_2_um_filter_36_22]PJB20491.1 MAG: hypothetical protein CO115_01200 [Candidatus F